MGIWRGPCKKCVQFWKTQDVGTWNWLKRENQQDATNSMFIIKLSISTCFGHHYAHHQDNKTVSYCVRCSAWLCRLWLAVVLWSCVVSFVHCVTVPVRLAASQYHSQSQPTHPGRTPHAVGHGLIILMMGIMMLKTCWDRKFDNKHRISCILLVLSLHIMFTMHGHKNLKHEIGVCSFYVSKWAFNKEKEICHMLCMLHRVLTSLTITVCHFLVQLRHMCGRWAEWFTFI